MVAKRLSSEQLYRLRNDIPIDRLIKDALDIPWRDTERCFRFLCPLCNEFNTAVNPATNLARCFRCEKNFNAIDLVMLITQSDFVNSIHFLKNYQKNNPNQIQPIKTDAKEHDKSPEHIGNVLKSIVTPPAPIAPSSGSGEDLCNRVLALEQKLECLVRRIEKIVKSPS